MNTSARPEPTRDSTFAASAAIATIERTTRKVRAITRRDAWMMVAAAALLVGVLLAQHLAPDAGWWTAAIAVGLIAVGVSRALRSWRPRQVVGRGAANRDVLAYGAAIVLYTPIWLIMATAPRGISIQVLALAAVPALPLLAGAIWGLRR
jgi:hypothetical protein